MMFLVRPELPTASAGSSQAPTAAVDNSASFASRPQSTYKSGKAVQTSGATSMPAAPSSAHPPLTITAAQGNGIKFFDRRRQSHFGGCTKLGDKDGLPCYRHLVIILKGGPGEAFNPLCRHRCPRSAGRFSPTSFSAGRDALGFCSLGLAADKRYSLCRWMCS